MQFDIFYNMESLFHNDNSIIVAIRGQFLKWFCTSTSAVMYAKVLVQKLCYKDISSKAFFTMATLLMPLLESECPFTDLWIIIKQFGTYNLPKKSNACKMFSFLFVLLNWRYLINIIYSSFHGYWIFTCTFRIEPS